MSALAVSNSTIISTTPSVTATSGGTANILGRFWTKSMYLGEEVWGAGDSPEAAQASLHHNLALAQAFEEDDPIQDWKRATGT